MHAQEYATEIVLKLKKAGYTAYFAGGWVRDHILQHPSADIDIATDAPPAAILDLFPHTLLVGLSFGVVIVIHQGMQFEVATFRKDLSYVNGRKPEQIELSTPLEDAKRRDFTINGMFYDPVEGCIYDFVGGAEDLKMGIIRTIGDPNERFIEDRLRMIRAIRFACRFGFTIAPETQQAIIDNADTLLPAVAMERIWQEFNKMTATGNFDHAVIEMHRLKLLPVIFPALKGVHLQTIKQQASAFRFYPKDCPTILFLLALFPGASLDQILDICQRLRISKQEMALASAALTCRKLVEAPSGGEHVDWVHFYALPHAELITQTDAANRPPELQSQLLLAHEARRKKFQRHIQRVIERKPLVNASLLIQRGIAPGEFLGSLLKKAEKIAIDHDLDTPEAVIQRLFT